MFIDAHVCEFSGGKVGVSQFGDVYWDDGEGWELTYVNPTEQVPIAQGRNEWGYVVQFESFQVVSIDGELWRETDRVASTLPCDPLVDHLSACKPLAAPMGLFPRLSVYARFDESRGERYQIEAGTGRGYGPVFAAGMQFDWVESARTSVRCNPHLEAP